ncbi:hypothetical protein [Deinococcus irradiatisoli]|nr:hypothetical protein [Deinococcus irradiatisoli]
MDNILVGEIQLREFPHDMFPPAWGEDDHLELSFPDIQLVVHGLPYFSLIEAFLEATGRRGDYPWIEGGIFHFWPEQFEDVQTHRGESLEDSCAEIDPVQCHYLYYGSGCGYTTALIRRYSLNGCTGLLIESSYCGDDNYWDEHDPARRFPVPPVFVPLSSWAKAANTRRPLFPASHVDSSLELDRLLGEDAVVLLQQVPNPLKPYILNQKKPEWYTQNRIYTLDEVEADVELYQGVDFSPMFELPNTIPEEWEG